MSQSERLKFEEHDFVLPDGEPMSITEIVDMLNSTTGITPASLPKKRSYKNSEYVGVPRLIKTAASSDCSVTVALEEIPPMDVLSRVEEALYTVHPYEGCCVVLGWDLYLALKNQLEVLTHVGYGSDVLQFNGVKILSSRTRGMLDVVFENPFQALGNITDV